MVYVRVCVCCHTLTTAVAAALCEQTKIRLENGLLLSRKCTLYLVVCGRALEASLSFQSYPSCFSVCPHENRVSGILRQTTVVAAGTIASRAQKTDSRAATLTFEDNESSDAKDSRRSTTA